MDSSNGIWCEVRLHDVARVIDDYQLWKHDAWYDRVNWLLAAETLAQVLEVTAREGEVIDLVADLGSVERELSDDDRAGLASLVMEPITVTPIQLINGGHRLAAMRKQAVRRVPGWFHRDDVGVAVARELIYPILSR